MPLDLNPLSPNYGKPLAPADDLDLQIIEEERQGRETLRRAAMLSTADRDPNRVAAIRQLAASEQRAPGEIEADITRFRTVSQASNIDWSGVPQRARRLAEADATAPIVRDDLDQLTGLSRAIGMMGHQFRAGRDLTQRSLLRELASRRDLTPAEQAEYKALRERGREVSGKRDFSAEWLGVAANAVGTMYESTLEALPTASAAGAAAAGTAALLGQLGPQALAPEELATVPAAFGVAFATKAFEVSARQQKGEALENMDEVERREGRRLDPDVKDMAATVHGLMGGLLDTASLGIVTAPLRRMVTEAGRRALVRPSTQAAFVRFAEAYGASVLGEATTETLQELSNFAATEAAKKFSEGDWGDDPQAIEDRLAQTFIETTKAMLLLGPFIPAGGLAMDLRAVQRANDRVSEFKEFAEWVSDVKLRDRDPAEFRATVDEEGAQAGIESVFISAPAFRTYFQSKGMDPELVAQELGVTDQLLEIGDLDRDIEIPLGTFAERVVPTEHYAELVNDVRFHAMDMSAREAKDGKDTIAAYVKQAEDEAAAFEEAEVVIQQEAQQVFDAVVAKQVAAGTPVSVAQKNAALHRAFFRTLARDRGTSALGEYQAWTFGVERPGITPDGKPMRGFRQEPVTADELATFAADVAQRHDLGAFDLRARANGDIQLETIATREAGAGVGTQAMQELIDFADARGARLVLSLAEKGYQPIEDGPKTTSPNRLREFYRRFGFVDNKGRARDFEISDGMYRVPKVRTLQQSATTVSRGRIRRTVDDLVAAAESQSSWKSWYERHESVLIELFGNDADLFQKMLSATSQATGVKGNVSLALKAYQQYLNGDPFTGYLPAVIKNLDRIRADEELRGAKISQYGKANEGDTDAIAVDRHIAMLFFNTKSPSRAQIEAAKARIRKVADRLEWEPRQVQAALWAYNQVRLGTDPSKVESYDKILEARADFIAELRARYGREEGRGVPSGSDVAARGPEEGLTLQQEDEGPPRGEIEFTSTGSVIRMFEAEDLSTFLHESGHLFLEIIGRSDSRPEMKAAILSWLGLERWEDITVEHHERWARAFEAYLHEGRAPSADLVSAFRAFRDWLVEVYKAITSADMQAKQRIVLTPTIRGVFDRMLATDDEIAAQGQAHSIVPVLDALEGSGMTSREAKGYAAKVKAAAMEAREKLLAKAMRQVRRQHTVAYKERKEALAKEAEAQVNTLRVYRAQHYLLTGTLIDSDEPPAMVAKLSMEGVVRVMGKKTAARFKRYTGEGGMDPDTLAPFLGYRTGIEMLEDFDSSPTKKQAIDMIVTRGLQAEFGDMLNDGTLEREALESLQTSEAQIELLVEEVRILRRMGVEADVQDAAARKVREDGPPDALAAEDAVADAGDGVLDALIAGVEPLGPAINQMAAEGAQAEATILRAGNAKAKAATNKATRFTADELAAMKTAAADAVARRKVRAAGSVQTFMAEEARAFRALAKAIAGRKWDEAAMAARQRLFSRLLTAAGVRTKREVTTGITYLRRMAKVTEGKTIDLEYVEQIHSLLERFDLKQVGSKKAEKRVALAEFLAKEREAGRETAVPESLEIETTRTPYQELTVEEFRGLVQAVKNIEHLGRLKRRLLDKRRRQEFETVKAAILDRILSKNPILAQSKNVSPDMAERFKGKIEKLHAEHTKLEFLFQALDGDEELGPVWDAFFRPFVDAENEELRRGTALQAQLKAIFDKVPKEERAKWQDRVHVPSLDMDFTRTELLSLALNWGNQGNRDALRNGQRDGQQWTEAQIEQALASLTDAEWDIVQDVWDLIDSLWPDIVELHRDVAGIQPDKVEALPFLTPNGKAMRGGYYPLSYNPALTFRAQQIDEKKSTEDLIANNFMRAATKQGHTKARMENVKQKVWLDIGVASRHLQDALHDLTHRRAIIDVNRLAMDKDIQAAIIGTKGQVMYSMIRPWLQAIAAGTPAPKTTMEQLFARLRAGASVVNMGWKISTAIVQPIGYTQTIDAIGEKWAMHGLSRFYGPGMREQVDFVFERSEQMRNRMKNFDRDVADTLRGIVAEERFAPIRQTFFWMTGMADLGTSMPSWLGAYAKAMEEYGNEETAIQYADMIVRTTQSSGSVKDLADIQRGSEFAKLLTAFYSYWNVFYNVAAKRNRQLKRTGNFPAFVSSLFYLWWLPAVLTEIVAGRAPDAEDDAEEWAKWALKKELIYPMASVVGLRDLVNVVATDFDYQMTPAAAAIGAIGDTAGNLFEDDGFTKSEAKLALAAVGGWFALPTRQVTITADAFYRDLVEGEDVPLIDYFLSPQRKAKQ